MEGIGVVTDTGMLVDGMLMATHSLVLPIVRRGRGVKNKHTNRQRWREFMVGWDMEERPSYINKYSSCLL